MSNLARLIAAAALGAAGAVSVGTAQAQDGFPQGSGTMEVGGAEISVGGGAASLWLPDVKGLVIKNANGATIHRKTLSDDFGNEWGGTVNGSVVVPLSGPGAIAWSGFWTNIQDNDTKRCNSSSNALCSSVNIVDDPNDLNTFPGIPGTQDVSKTDRNVDNWGTALEGRYYFSREGLAGSWLRTNYVAIGGDVRAIDQELRVKGTSPDVPSAIVRYNENLDTTYYGGYLAVGGEYSLFPGLYNGWGLRSFFTAQVGVYDANTDYSGRYSAFASAFSFSDVGKLSLSEDKAAVIAGLKFETRKQFGPRTSLALVSEYEWYSSVAQMRYNDNDVTPLGTLTGRVGTHIEDDDAFATRTSLRLNIGLGPAPLYPEPLK